ncbi:electron transfer flavoprotein subunit alpha/FixB family protein (plasmid) [Rhodococcus opacus]|uniref:electron transfer flavoprotein subunit alpha/FixB family protein n=1 Tax=Rhodococcus opacus TaxID=37919 RepID=UPI0034D1A5EA
MTPGIVAVLDTGENGFSDQALSTVTAAQEIAGQLGSDVTVLVLPRDGSDMSVQADWDVSELVVVDNAGGKIDGLAAQKIIGDFLSECGPTLVLMPNSGFAIEVAAGLAAFQGYGFGGNLQSLEVHNGLTATRSRYGGKVAETLGFDLDRTNVLTLCDGAFGPSPKTSDVGPLKTSSFVADEQASTRHLSTVIPEAGDVDITKADILLSIGRGVGSEENVARFATIAEKLGATLSASRPLVDVGWVDAARQVGQSGKIVKPKVYIALGISGSIQHVAGMRSASTIIAVNTDASAPIFDLADYGAVMDLDDLAEAFESVLETN